MKEILFFEPSWSNWQYCKLRWVFFSFLLTFHYWHWHSILLSADVTNGIFGTAASLIPYFVHQFLGSDLKQLPLKQTYFLFLWWLLIARPSQFTKVKESSKDLKTVLSKKYLPCNLVSSISFHYKRRQKRPWNNSYTRAMFTSYHIDFPSHSQNYIAWCEHTFLSNLCWVWVLKTLSITLNNVFWWRKTAIWKNTRETIATVITKKCRKNWKLISFGSMMKYSFFFHWLVPILIVIVVGPHYYNLHLNSWLNHSHKK